MMLDFIDIHEWLNGKPERAPRFYEKNGVVRISQILRRAVPYLLISVPLNDFALTLDYESSRYLKYKRHSQNLVR